MGLLERADARHQLDGWWAEARSGRGRFVLVEGEAGVGKTTLLDDFASRERERRAEVVWTGCEPATAPRPLGPLRDLGLAPDPDRLDRDALFRSVWDRLTGREVWSVLAEEWPTPEA